MGLHAYAGEDDRGFWSSKAIRAMDEAFIEAMEAAGHERTVYVPGRW